MAQDAIPSVSSKRSTAVTGDRHSHNHPSSSNSNSNHNHGYNPKRLRNVNTGVDSRLDVDGQSNAHHGVANANAGAQFQVGGNSMPIEMSIEMADTVCKQGVDVDVNRSTGTGNGEGIGDESEIPQSQEELEETDADTDADPNWDALTHHEPATTDVPLFLAARDKRYAAEARFAAALDDAHAHLKLVCDEILGVAADVYNVRREKLDAMETEIKASFVENEERHAAMSRKLQDFAQKANEQFQELMMRLANGQVP